MKSFLFMLLAILIIRFWSSARASSNQYIGSDSCQSCHQVEHQQWQTSDHHKAMQSPDAATVLGDFANKTVEFHNITTRFFSENNQYFVKKLNKQGQIQTFPVIYTFGFDPLQQYILDTGNGHIQAFNIAWDTRKIQWGTALVSSATQRAYYH
ncbi:MAG: hypothetical protein ACI9LX_001776 [Paraglaciecola sp.]|jgi:hypothetical protein